MTSKFVRNMWVDGSGRRYVEVSRVNVTDTVARKRARRAILASLPAPRTVRLEMYSRGAHTITYRERR